MLNQVSKLPIMTNANSTSASSKQNGVRPSESICQSQERPKKSIILSNRKLLHPISAGTPYQTTMRMCSTSEAGKKVASSSKSAIGQRVSSAKMLRVKQLQNQLADAHYHLNELANENRLLKALQKRQDSALRKYEGTNAELPRIINSHHEELRVLQTKYKKLKAQHRNACDLLKEKENEIHSLQVQNKHLQQLSKDRHLEEREKLQIRVSDLNHRISQLQETIQILNRKLTLESKSLKHQLHLEISKHKETQKHLNETLEKLKNLEELLDNREKRMYFSGHFFPTFKNKTSTNQSLTNVADISTSRDRGTSRSKVSQEDSQNRGLPILGSDGLTEKSQISAKTETMSSFQQIRRFRLQKSANCRTTSSLETDAFKRSLEHDVPETTTRCRSQDNLSFTESQKGNDEPEKILEEESYKVLERLQDTVDDDSESEKEDESLNKRKNRETPKPKIASRRSSVKSIDMSEFLETSSENSRKLYRKLVENQQEEEEELEKNDEVKVPENNFQEEEEGDEEIKENTTALEKYPRSRRVLESLSDDELEESQKRLIDITRSWSLLQEKIAKDRRAADGQLKDLDESVHNNQGNQDSEDFGNAVEDETIEFPVSDDFVEKELAEVDSIHDRLLVAASENGTEPKMSNGVIGDDREDDTKALNYNKDKLLAAIKAIDDNENIEFLDTKRSNSGGNMRRSQITDNLYRGVPSHAKKKDELIKEIFGDSGKGEKIQSKCSKMH